MKYVKITAPRGVFLGATHHHPGEVLTALDDAHAARLVAQGLAEHVVPAPAVAPAPPVETAVAPKPPERSTSRRQR